MATEKKCKTVNVDPRKLEQVRRNLQEQMDLIARIAKATLGGPASRPTAVKLTASFDSPAAGGDPQVAVQVTCNVDFEDGSTACYEDPPGVCCAGPCPC